MGKTNINFPYYKCQILVKPFKYFMPQCYQLQNGVYIHSHCEIVVRTVMLLHYSVITRCCRDYILHDLLHIGFPERDTFEYIPASPRNTIFLSNTVNLSVFPSLSYGLWIDYVESSFYFYPYYSIQKNMRGYKW